MNFVKRTIGEEWSLQWKQVIRDEIFLYQSEQGGATVMLGMFGGNNFWYTPTKATWPKILNNQDILASYLDFSKFKFKEHRDHITLNKPTLLPDQIPIPRARKSSRKTESVQANLQAQAQDNTQFLLEQVLDRLDSMTMS